MLGLIVEVTSLYYGHTLSWVDLLDVFHHSLCHRLHASLRGRPLP